MAKRLTQVQSTRVQSSPTPVHQRKRTALKFSNKTNPTMPILTTKTTQLISLGRVIIQGQLISVL